MTFYSGILLIVQGVIAIMFEDDGAHGGQLIAEGLGLVGLRKAIG